MFYIHRFSCISPQNTFPTVDFDKVEEYTENKLYAKEPAYQGIPSGVLRRMGKAVRIGVGAALPIIKDNKDISGIIIGTANGGLEDCIKFLNQIIEYEEGTLTPTNFVQSTANAIASQISLMSSNRGYNVTHVHRGHAFENAVIDADMFIKENPEKSLLIGGVDEISIYNYNMQYLSGQYKSDTISNFHLYNTDSVGSIAGEGSAMFLVNGIKDKSVAKLEGIKILASEDRGFIEEQLRSFLKDYLRDEEELDLLLSGENGDNRMNNFYSSCERILSKNITIARFKHLMGEHQSATALSVFLGCSILESKHVPEVMLKSKGRKNSCNKILIYNTYGSMQHTFILLSGVN